MYIEKRELAGRFMLVSKYSGRIGKHKGSRAKRHNKSCDSVKQYNQKLRGFKMLGYILCNFDSGFFITLKYLDSNYPASYQEAALYIKKFIKEVRAAARQQDKVFKCIWVTEKGTKENRLHHHIIIENDKAIRELIYLKWHGGIHLERIGVNRQYKELADYIVKDKGKEEREKGASLYSVTRNLKKPIQELPIVHLCAMPREPVTPSGYV